MTYLLLNIQDNNNIGLFFRYEVQHHQHMVGILWGVNTGGILIGKVPKVGRVRYLRGINICYLLLLVYSGDNIK